MSDVVGTILLLALTVTLFSSIFFFVSTFPSPAPQSANQFTASLTYNGPGTSIIGVSVLHLAGPAVSGTSLVYLYSSAHPNRFTTPFSVSSGLGGAAVWNLGQTWFQNITTYSITTPDNITISVVSTNQLLFRITLPGNTPTSPPTFVQIGTSPSLPTIGQAFTVYAQINDPTLNANSVYANLSMVPGVSGKGLFKMTYSASTGLWTYVLPTGTSITAGTFYVFVNATDSTSGLKNSAAFTVTIVPGTTSFTALLTVNNTAPMAGSPVTMIAYVSAGGAGGPITVAFSAGGAAVGSGSGSVSTGSTTTFSTSWTPSSPGVYLLKVLVNSSGSVVAGSSLNLTVFPTILFVGHNVPSGTRTVANESAYLAQELTSAGVPYTSMWVSCSAGLPAATTFQSYSVVVIDFGSTWVGGCPKFPSTTEQAKLTGAAGTSFLVVGANAFGSANCASFSSAYFGLFGLAWASSGTCVTIPNATAAMTWTSATGVGLRSDGIPATLTANQTLAGSAKFVPYDYFPKGSTGTGFLKTGVNVVGSIPASGKGAALGLDPALLTTALPGGNLWGTGQGGSAVLYNLIGYLSGFATSSTAGRALTDYGVTQTTILGLSHTKLTTIYVGVRENGPAGAAVAATLLVNGSVALYNGLTVYGIATVSGSGGLAWITLTWVAPANGPFTLSVVLSVGSGDLYRLNDQMPLSILNQATTFT